MRLAKILLISAVTLLVAAALFAQDFQLVYVDGSVDVQRGGKWVPLYAGDTVASNSSIRIKGGAIAEFSGPGDTLLFSSPGTYRLISQAKNSSQTDTSAISAIFGRLSRVGSEQQSGPSEVMGVRGSEAVNQDGFAWMDEDSMAFQDAKDAFSAGDYTDTVEILENEVDPILLEDQGAYYYYLAASYDSLGKAGPALKILLDNDVDTFSSSYADYLFLKGRLSFESRNYSEAVASLQTYIKQDPPAARRQLAYFLLGASYAESGKITESENALTEAVRINADEEISGLARKLLE